MDYHVNWLSVMELYHRVIEQNIVIGFVFSYMRQQSGVLILYSMKLLHSVMQNVKQTV
jgi:hypothetical protein